MKDMKGIDNADFDYLYDYMSEGQKQHMVNRIYARDGIYPQKLEKYVPVQEPTYKQGDRFKLARKASELGMSNNTYLLAMPRAHGAQLINVQTGTRWNDKIVPVRSTVEITHKEMVDIVGSSDVVFEKVK